MKKLFAAIAKVEEQDDGTVKVWGYASSEAEDSDGETITAEAMKAALPDYMKWANVREMHQPKAAGTAIEAEVQEDGRTWFGAHVIDSEAVKKVRAGVYKGFSIGGRVTERDELNKAIIKGIKLVEVSLVDRPANPEAVFTVVKAEGIEEEQPSAIDQIAELLNKGEISPEALLELAKGEKGGNDDPEQHEANEEAEIKKGMYSLQDFASALNIIGYLAGDAQYESDWEGDNSPIPAQLREWLAQGIEIFKAMAAEETAEMLANLKSAAGEIGVVELAERTGMLQKAGARFSKSTKAALGEIHKAMKECDAKLAAMGYDTADDDEDEEADKAAKGDDLAKVSGELDLAKADLAKVSAERDGLAKRVKELEAMPQPGKALLKAVTKGEDVTGIDQEKPLDVVTKADGTVNEVASLIKSIHRGAAG